MTEQDIVWVTVPVPVPGAALNFYHEATIEGLMVRVTDRNRYVVWTVSGFVQDIAVRAHDLYLEKHTVEEAQAEAVAVARRLHALGWRGDKGEES